MRNKIIRVLQVAIGCTLATGIASMLGLPNSVSAGIITILSLQNTKKETLRSAVDRFAAYALTVVLSVLVFGLLGYTVLTFGLYLLLFAAACYALNLQASLPICTVLASHFWLAETTALWFIGNETTLMVIGSAIGIGLNLFLPRNVRAIRDAQRHIEDILRQFFHDASAALTCEKDAALATADLDRLEEALREAQETVDTLTGNTLRSDVRYYVLYIDMRRHQYAIARRMEAALGDIEIPMAQAKPLAAFMQHIADTLHEHNDAAALLEELRTIHETYRQGELPQTRDEFETRASLYNIMIDTEHLLLIKRSFVDGLTPEQRRTFLSQQQENALSH